MSYEKKKPVSFNETLSVWVAEMRGSVYGPLYGHLEYRISDVRPTTAERKESSILGPHCSFRL